MDKGTFFLFCKEENGRQFRYEVTFSMVPTQWKALTQCGFHADNGKGAEGTFLGVATSNEPVKNRSR